MFIMAKKIEYLILIFVFTGLIITPIYADDDLFLKMMDDSFYQLDNALQGYDSNLNEKNSFSIISSTHSLYGLSGEIYESIDFFDVSSEYKDLKEKFLESLKHFQNAGLYGPKAASLIDMGCAGCAESDINQYSDEMEAGISLYLESQAIMDEIIKGKTIGTTSINNPVSTLESALESKSMDLISNDKTSINAEPEMESDSSKPCDCSGDSYNCCDFSSQSDAQECYEYCLSKVGKDIHRLDGNNDGKTCNNAKCY